MKKFEDILEESIPERTEDFDNRPIIATTFSDGVKRPVSNIAKEALDLIVSKNENLYHTRKALGTIQSDEHGHHFIRILDKHGVHGNLSNTANFVRVAIKDTEKGSVKSYHFDNPLLSYSENILSYQQYDDIRKLRGIYHHPILTREGILDFSIGYNEKSGVFIPETSYFDRQEMIVPEAKLTLLELIQDFHFQEDSSAFMALALPITMICRQFINDATPIFGFVGDSGSGKSLLVKALYKLVTGTHVPEQQTPHNAAEWNKVIFSRLLTGEELIYFDNVNRRDDHGNDIELESNALASAVTAGLFTDRILGVSETRSVEVNSTFALSGIGIDTLISEELYKRLVFVRLFPNDKSPDEFRFYPLLQHIESERPQLMSAYMTLIQDWIDAGKPKGSKYLNRFETWASVIGGIFENAGIYDAIPNPTGHVNKITKPRDIYQNFLRSHFVPAETGRVSVAAITKMWENLVIEGGQNEGIGNLGNLSPQKRNQWMREVFKNTEYTRVHGADGKTRVCWKGLALKGN